MTQLEQVFQAPVIEAYGMTEAAHQIASNPLPPQARKPGSVGKAAGPEVAVLDAMGQVVAAGSVGEVAIRGANVTAGYHRNPAANLASFSHGWLRTGDQGWIDADGYIFLSGRFKELINRGGEKIAPRQVEDVLLTHPAITEAAVCAVPHATLGEDVAAAVVVRDGATVTMAELWDFAAQRLALFKVPQQIQLVTTLPKSPTGKVERQKLAKQFGSIEARCMAQEDDNAAPRTALEAVLIELYGQVLGGVTVGRDDHFFQLGGDSIRAMQLLACLRQTCHSDLSVAELFAAPTVAALAQRLAQRPAAEGQATALSLHPVARQQPLPLSFAQQRLWFLEQLVPDLPVYHDLWVWRCRGPLHTDALTQSLGALLQRHEALRSIFPSVDGQPVQQILPVQPCPLPIVDMRAMAVEERDACLQALARGDAREPFDLARGPLLRVKLVQFDALEHVLLVTMHHCITDGWSKHIVWRDLATFYHAHVTGQDASLPGLPIQYADFAHWQRQWLQGEALQRHLAYWQQHLAGAPPLLALPTDRPRPAVQTFRGARQMLSLSATLRDALATLSRAYGVTLFMTLLAALQTLLYRYTGQEDIVVGTPIAGRTQRETEEVVGCFMNTLVLRTDLRGNPPFQELLQRVRSVAIEAYAHQELPFEKLVEALQPERNLSHTPVLQVLLNFRNMPQHTPQLYGLQVTEVACDPGIAQCDVTLDVTDGVAGLVCVLEYNTDLFEAGSITRLLGHWQTLLHGIVAHPDTPLATLPLLTPAERQQLLGEWNATQVTYPQPLCLHQLFEAQAERTPEAIAVVYENTHLTYRQLNQRAEQLAGYLQQLGIGPDNLVGLCVPGSLDLVVGVLGILKAGGAYVPLDPEYPRARLVSILHDTQATVVVTQQDQAEQFRSASVRTVCLDTDWQAIASAKTTALPSVVTPVHLAYVIYTSGSTGEPKGVLVEHRAMYNHLCWMQATFPLTATDRVLQHTSCSFDVSVWEFFGPLAAGAQLVLARPGGQRDSVYLTALIAQQHITTLQIVPAMLQALLVAGLGHCRSLRQVFCGGEALPEELQQSFQRSLDAALYNLYGPTETTIDATYWVCQAELPYPSIPIGRPLANVQVYVCDAHLQPVPIGVTGEVYVGGAGLARGYLRRPDLTAAKFVPHPFCNDPGQRLYKTGDLARYLPDGSLAFLGRLDEQAKIRGFRIEPGEIAAVVRRYPGVRQALVVARQEDAGEKRLVAYVLWEDAARRDVQGLQSFLQAQLPAYMVPTALVSLESLPVTSNGKVNYQALPQPAERRSQGQAYQRPQTETERIIAAVWQAVLQRDCLDIHDNFFDLGGHSLLLTQVQSKLCELLQTHLTMVDMFRYPTIHTLAAYVGGQHSTGRASQKDNVGVPTGVSRQERLQQLYQRTRQHRM